MHAIAGANTALNPKVWRTGRIAKNAAKDSAADTAIKKAARAARVRDDERDAIGDGTATLRRRSSRLGVTNVGAAETAAFLAWAVSSVPMRAGP